MRHSRLDASRGGEAAATVPNSREHRANGDNCYGRGDATEQYVG